MIYEPVCASSFFFKNQLKILPSVQKEENMKQAEG